MNFKAVLLFIIALVGLVACQENEKIIGEWKLVEIDYSRHLETIHPELKSAFQTMADRQGQTILGQTFFDFQADGTLIITSPKFDTGSISDKGKWELNEAKDTLYVINSDSEKFAFNQPESNTLILYSAQKPLRKMVLIRE